MTARALVTGFAITLGLLLASAPGFAQTFSSGSTGADGAFAPACAPMPCTVTSVLPASGLFNFTSVNVPSGVTVRFARNVVNTPVTMLATGNVVIAGTIDVSGGPGGNGISGATSIVPTAGGGGPGGFDGGNGSIGVNAAGPSGDQGGKGLGPGGGIAGGCGGSYGAAGGCSGVPYGTADLLRELEAAPGLHSLRQTPAMCRLFSELFMRQVAGV